MKKLSVLLIILIFSFPLNAQILKRANKLFDSFSYKEAIELYEIVWKRDSLNENVTKKLAISYRLINDTHKSELWYSRVVKGASANSDDYKYYAKALQSNEKYKEAQIWIDKADENNSSRINLSNIQRLITDSLRYKVQTIKSNSEASDLGVCFYNQDIVFSSARKVNSLIKRNDKWNNQDFLRLYIANIDSDGELINTRLFSNKLETNHHDGPVCFNSQGDEMFLTRNYLNNSKRVKRNNNGIVTIMIYYSKMVGDKWSDPELLPFNIEGYSTGHPTLSNDGKKLYFISDRPGGFGGTDLYVCHRDQNGWGKAVNLGSQVNTPDNEMFPFVSQNNILYFASNGHAGLGGLDVFSIDLNNNDAKPVNLGYPVNTSKDDFGLIIKDGNGYFASNRLKGQSFDDIYKFSVQQKVINGKVYNLQTNKILGNTIVTLYNENGSSIKTIKTTESGEFSFFVDKDVAYNIKSVKEGFLNGQVDISSSDLGSKMQLDVTVYQSTDDIFLLEGLVVFKDDQKPIQGMTISVYNKQNIDTLYLVSDSSGKFSCKLNKKIIYDLQYHKKNLMSKYKTISFVNSSDNKMFVREEFEMFKIGKSFVLDNILYDSNKSDIRADAAYELDKLVIILQKNPNMIIELSSHTDSRGSSAYNMILSNQRAKKAVDYIISRGIDSERIVAKGYGETKLLNECNNGVECSNEKHQVNRRTEIKILSF